MSDTLTRALDVEAFLATLAGPGHAVDVSVAGLCELWELAPSPDRLRTACAAAGVEVDEWEALELQIRLGEELALETTRTRTPAPPAPGRTELVEATRDEHRGAGLTVSEDLAACLPLMELAADVASELGSLSVLLVDSPRIAPALGLASLAGHWSEDAVVLIDSALSGIFLRTVWAHELSHVLDPRPPTYPAAEAFADGLAALLLEEEPTTLDEASPLIGAALRGSLDFTWPEAGTLDALLWWALLEVRAA